MSTPGRNVDTIKLFFLTFREWRELSDRFLTKTWWQ